MISRIDTILSMRGPRRELTRRQTPTSYGAIYRTKKLDSPKSRRDWRHSSAQEDWACAGPTDADDESLEEKVERLEEWVNSVYEWTVTEDTRNEERIERVERLIRNNSPASPNTGEGRQRT